MLCISSLYGNTYICIYIVFFYVNVAFKNICLTFKWLQGNTQSISVYLNVRLKFLSVKKIVYSVCHMGVSCDNLAISL